MACGKRLEKTQPTILQYIDYLLVHKDPTYHTAVYRLPTCTQRQEIALYVRGGKNLPYSVYINVFIIKGITGN